MPHVPPWRESRVYTLGHSTRSLEEVLAMLDGVHVATVADVRRHPGSRRFPHFQQHALARSLATHGIAYAHLAELGGRRRARGDRRARSPNAAWRVESFRAYADHLGTSEFAHGLARLHALCAHGPVALLCAEAVPWRCHRRLIADALLVRGCIVEHLLGRGRTQAHELPRFARPKGRRVTYPPPRAGSRP
jgi:uncharacterized protein (DUF488 family)